MTKDLNDGRPLGNFLFVISYNYFYICNFIQLFLPKKTLRVQRGFSCLFLDKLPQIDELNYHNCKYFLIKNVEDVFIFNDYNNLK